MLHKRSRMRLSIMTLLRKAWEMTGTKSRGEKMHMCVVSESVSAFLYPDSTDRRYDRSAGYRQ
jgi:hypothetical protein